MNRAERRKNGNKHVRTYTLNEYQIEQLKNEAVSAAVDKSFILMLALPAMAFHDHRRDLWKLVVDGKGYQERFIDYVLDLYDSFNRGYITLDDCIDTIRKEAGVDIIMCRDGRKII